MSKIKIAVMPCGTMNGFFTSVYDRRKEEKEIMVYNECERTLRRTNAFLFDKKDRKIPAVNRKYDGCKRDSSFKNTYSTVRLSCSLMIEAIKQNGHARPVNAYRASMEIDNSESETSMLKKKTSTIDCCCTVWGLFSDVDLELENRVEWVRRFIPTFFTEMFVIIKHLILNKRRSCKIIIHNDEAHGGVIVEQGNDFCTVMVGNLNYANTDILYVPGARVDDQYLHIMFVRACNSWFSNLMMLLQCLGTDHLTKSGDKYTYYRTKSKVEIIVGGKASDSELSVCGFGEKPFSNSYCIDSNGEKTRKNVGLDRHLTCTLLPGYIKLMLPNDFYQE